MSKTTLLAACFTIVSLGSGLEPHAARGAEPATDRIAELRARFANDPRVKEANAALAAAEKALEKKLTGDAALDRKTKELLKDLPEIKAAQRARKDFDDAVAASPAYKAAEAARRAIAEKVAADEKVQAQAGKLKAAGDAQAQHRDQIEVIEKKIRNAAEQAAAKDAGVREAVKAAEVARARVGQTVEDRAAVERKARQAARAVWDEKVKAVIAENPEAKALLKEMQSLEEKLRKLRSQVGELSRLVVQ